MADETVLVISPIGVPPYSARGITETLAPIEAAGSFERTVNGGLTSVGGEQFQKYRAEWSAEDMDAPAAAAVFPGATITVDCISELSYLTASGSPIRPVVPGSERVSGDFTFYRPQLVMMITGFQVETDEWGAAVAWQLSAEEV